MFDIRNLEEKYDRKITFDISNLSKKNSDFKAKIQKSKYKFPIKENEFYYRRISMERFGRSDNNDAQNLTRYHSVTNIAMIMKLM